MVEVIVVLVEFLSVVRGVDEERPLGFRRRAQPVDQAPDGPVGGEDRGVV